MTDDKLTIEDKPLRIYIGKHGCDDLPYVHDVDPDPRTGDPRFTFDGSDYSGWYVPEKRLVAVLEGLGASKYERPDYPGEGWDELLDLPFGTYLVWRIEGK